MARVKLSELLAWTGGETAAMPQVVTDPVFEGISTDTRAIRPGFVFLALRGKTHDGHDFLRAAADAGATALIIENAAFAQALPHDREPIIILVEDTLKALQDIAAGYRRTLPAHVVGISGSVGKTSTRQMIAACLQPALRIHQTSGNLNNEIGLPQTLLQAAPEHQAVVLEMGMRGPGEISLLSRIAAPDIAVLTCIGLSHIERLGSQEAILAAKAEIIDGLAPGGLLLLNGDDPLLRRWGSGLDGRCRLAWTSADTERAAELSLQGEFAIGASAVHAQPHGCDFRAVLFVQGAGREEAAVRLPMPGIHHVQNSLLGLAVAHALEVAMPVAAAGAAASENTGNRQRLIEVDGLLIMDDSYNASPESMLAAMRTLSSLAGERRKLAALGCMLELGDYAHDAHVALGRQAAEHGFARIYATGSNAEDIIAGAHDTKPELPAYVRADNLAVAGALLQDLQPGDCILVKGSRGYAMEKVTEAILKHLSETET